MTPLVYFLMGAAAFKIGELIGGVILLGVEIVLEKRRPKMSQEQFEKLIAEHIEAHRRALEDKA